MSRKFAPNRALRAAFSEALKDPDAPRKTVRLIGYVFGAQRRERRKQREQRRSQVGGA